MGDRAAGAVNWRAMPNEALRSRVWSDDPRPRYWWHRLPGHDYVPPVYAALSDAEWAVVRAWYEATDGSDAIGECAVPLISLLHGLIGGNRIARIVQLGTCVGYSALLLGFFLRKMGARHGLFTLDIGAEICAFAQSWLSRAELDDFVRVAQLDSRAPHALDEACAYLGGPPEMLIIDSSHEYGATLSELALWYPALAPGGIIVLHDVSRFAVDFDVTGEGGVRRAFEEWRKLHPAAETFLLNGEARVMEAPRGLYKDACGVALIHKPGLPAAS